MPLHRRLRVATILLFLMPCTAAAQPLSDDVPANKAQAGSIGQWSTGLSTRPGRAAFRTGKPDTSIDWQPTLLITAHHHT
jgi:hypothetical protein